MKRSPSRETLPPADPGRFTTNTTPSTERAMPRPRENRDPRAEKDRLGEHRHHRDDRDDERSVRCGGQLDAAGLEEEVDRHAEKPADRQGQDILLPQARPGVESAQEQVEDDRGDHEPDAHHGHRRHPGVEDRLRADERETPEEDGPPDGEQREGLVRCSMVKAHRSRKGAGPQRSGVIPASASSVSGRSPSGSTPRTGAYCSSSGGSLPLSRTSPAA